MKPYAREVRPDEANINMCTCSIGEDEERRGEQELAGNLAEELKEKLERVSKQKGSEEEGEPLDIKKKGCHECEWCGEATALPVP